MDHTERLHFLFEKYLSRNCTAWEVEELMTLLQEADAENALNAPMQELWAGLRDQKTEYDVDWNKMYGMVTAIGEQDNFPVKRSAKFNWIRVAAILVVTGTSLGIYWNFKKEKAPHPAPVGAIAVEKEKPADKRQTIHLPDGSTVILNAASKLDYPSAFPGSRRDVFLTGEGYFDIKHRSDQPFFVHTGKIVTRVLGTAFDIRAYPGDESVEITVTRGKVQVWKEEKNLGLITANEQISFSKKTGLFAQKIVDTKLVVAWKPGEISFNDITMQEAAKQIAQRFHTTIEFSNPAIRECRVTATFSEDDLLEEILTVICGVSTSNYTIQQDKIIINGKGCKD